LTECDQGNLEPVPLQEIDVALARRDTPDCENVIHFNNARLLIASAASSGRLHRPPPAGIPRRRIRSSRTGKLRARKNLRHRRVHSSGRAGIAGDQLSFRELAALMTELTRERYRIFRPRGLGLLHTKITITKSLSPKVPSRSRRATHQQAGWASAAKALFDAGSPPACGRRSEPPGRPPEKRPRPVRRSAPAAAAT